MRSIVLVSGQNTNVSFESVRSLFFTPSIWRDATRKLELLVVEVEV